MGGHRKIDGTVNLVEGIRMERLNPSQELFTINSAYSSYHGVISIHQQGECAPIHGRSESVHVVVKHARVNEATVALTRPITDTIEVVADGGQGFDVRRHIGRYSSPSGFGLFSISERLEYIGGSARIESAPGCGTRVTLSAPLQSLSGPDEEHAGAGGMMRAEAEEEADDSRIRILLAHDHAIVRKGLLRLLEDQPDFVIVGEAADGHAAVEMAQELHPDVVLMDLAMPHMDGIEATHRAVCRHPRRQTGVSRPPSSRVIMTGWHHRE